MMLYEVVALQLYITRAYRKSQVVKLDNVWVFIQLIRKPTRTKNQLYKNPNLMLPISSVQNAAPFWIRARPSITNMCKPRRPCLPLLRCKQGAASAMGFRTYFCLRTQLLVTLTQLDKKIPLSVTLSYKSRICITSQY